MPAKVNKILDFKNPIEFLTAKIGKGGAYSLRAVAKRAGISPTLLSMILRGERTLKSDVAKTLASSLGLSNAESRVLVKMVEKSDPIAAWERWIFSPLHHTPQGQDKDRREAERLKSGVIPSEYLDLLIGNCYVTFGDPHIFGKKKEWRQDFICQKDNLVCQRDHEHPSKKSEEIRFIPKELIWQPFPYLFILWEEPVPQIHSLPLSPDFLSGKKVVMSDSGIISEVQFKRRREKESE